MKFIYRFFLLLLITNIFGQIDYSIIQSDEQKLILFEEGTEPPGSSELNYEKREGSYHCANCGVKLFQSSAKFESGSGWPSFYESLPNVFETKTINLRYLILFHMICLNSSRTFFL